MIYFNDKGKLIIDISYQSYKIDKNNYTGGACAREFKAGVKDQQL